VAWFERGADASRSEIRYARRDHLHQSTVKEQRMSAVMIGVDPHKASHTAVALDDRESDPGRVRILASGRQAEQLLSWAAQWPTRTWAIEGAWGLGYLTNTPRLRLSWTDGRYRGASSST
jgi:hypothetical protein